MSIENDNWEKDMLSDSMLDVIYLLGCGVNEIAPNSDYVKAFMMRYDATAMQRLYLFCRAHFVDALTGTVLKKAGVKLPNEWDQNIAKAIRKVILFDQERQIIFSFMDKQGIWHMPLKGVILKDFYPSIGMRQMSDNDILFDREYAKEVHDYMVSRGYQVESYDLSNHDVYEKAPIYNFEMHTSLYEAGYNREWVDYYDNVLDRLTQKKGTLEYYFTNEDFYVYIVTHAYKHYNGSGTGIRSLLDFYVYLNRLEDILDFHYIEAQCKILGIADFEKENRILGKKVFATNKLLIGEGADQFRFMLSDEEKKNLYYYMTSGVYGTWERSVKNSMHHYRKKDGSISKAAYVLRQLFPGKEQCKNVPLLKRHHWLLPFYWGYRFFRMLFSKERRQRTLGELDIVMKYRIQ